MKNLSVLRVDVWLRSRATWIIAEYRARVPKSTQVASSITVICEMSKIERERARTNAIKCRGNPPSSSYQHTKKQRKQFQVHPKSKSLLQHRSQIINYFSFSLITLYNIRPFPPSRTSGAQHE